MRLLFVTPHLSTGGLPQYLLKKIETFSREHDVYCVEWENITGGVFVVQRNGIRSILGKNFISLSEVNSNFLDIVKNISPDIIHFEEIPETFIEKDLLNKIYNINREYKIVVTTHSSYTKPESLQFLADKFILVSEWSKEVFYSHFGDSIPCDIWEYPILKEDYNKDEYRQKLGFDPNYKHVLNVGLFTPGKNQSELIEIARLFDRNDWKVKFHFVGNQADNFRDYWNPIMSNLPSNCIIHGEKSNVSDYYKASDVFYFTSNFELNPLCLKEAISFDLKVFAKKLHTYKNQYDDFVEFISGDVNQDSQKLLNYLNPGKEITGWFSYSKIYDLFVNEAKDNSTIVEIGSWFGRSTKYLLDKIESSGKLISLEVIDTFKGTLNEELHQEIVKDFDGDIYQTFYENIELNSNIVVHKNYSHDSSELFYNNSIDYLLIDGDHSYEGVTSDINNYFYKVKPGGIIAGDDYNVFDGTTAAVNEYFLGAHTLYGNNYNWFYRIPKVQIIHVSTTPQQDRAKKSIKNFELLKRYGIDLKFIQNPVYTGEIDITKYANPSSTTVKPSHYGCFLGHTQALREIDDDNYDFTLILEEDAYIHSSVKEFVDVLWKAIFCCQVDKSIAYVSFGSDIWVEKRQFNSIFDESWHQILAHCYLIPNNQKSWYMEKLSTGIWDSADLWYNLIFNSGERKRLVSKKNYSKQLDGVSIIDGEWKSYSGGYYGPIPTLNDFDWGNTSDWYINTMKKEIFEERIYEKFTPVESGDIVVDFGASIGPFVKTIMEKNPIQVYTFEPCDEEYQLLIKNINDKKVTHLNYGVADVNSDSILNTNLFSFKEDKQVTMKTMTFKKFINDFNIKKIDFLKSDCEGGEYSIFTEENFDWIKSNVRKIAGEWHLNTHFDVDSKEKFRKFRDVYLSKMTNHYIYSVDGVDIKWDLWNEHFIEYYNEVIIYIDNR